ncbi:MAG: hypothetical protein J6Y08_10835 [Clostridiales bacterium]|nr:hypothetical protein [Clostridiales bacterium]
MRKIRCSIILALAVLLSVFACSCKGWEEWFDEDAFAKEATVGQFRIYYVEGKTAFVDAYFWSGDPEDTVIDFPDEYNANTPVKKLGGESTIGVTGHSGGFSIEAPKCDVYFKSLNPSDYGVPVTFEDLVFTLNFGENLELIYDNHTSLYAKNAIGNPYRYLPVSQSDGSVIFYRVLVVVNVSPDNSNYYSKDGIMYSKATDKKIEAFPYAADVK